jgi:hypothetical protein
LNPLIPSSLLPFFEPFSFFLLFMEILLLLLRTFVSCFILTDIVAILLLSPSFCGFSVPPSWDIIVYPSYFHFNHGDEVLSLLKDAAAVPSC